MFRTRRLYALLCFLVLVLLLVNVVVYTSVWGETGKTLTVSFLNVGQGDAILIQSPTGVEMLIDGGPNRSVVRELPKLLGPLDRSLDVVIVTHPDRDHIEGLIDAFERYAVSYVLRSGVLHDTSTTVALDGAIAREKDVAALVARRGMRVHLGAGAYADILAPDRDVTNVETNTASVIVRVVYGDTEFMLPGDAPFSIEEWLVAQDPNGAGLQSDVLKAGHHGSKHSTGALWLSVIRPQLVIVSAGKDNSYGHPSPEMRARVEEHGATLLSTIDEGTITLVSDGKTIQVQ